MAKHDDPEFRLLLAQTFSDPRARGHKIWVVDDAELPGKAMHGDRITSGPATLYFFNLFQGHQPYLYDYEYLYGGNYNVALLPTIMCDSNLAGHLHRLVSKPEEMDPHWKAVTLEFLRRAKTHRYDFNSLFYVLEASAKHTFEGFEKYAAAVDHSFFVLHTMDDEEFLKTGAIRRSTKDLRSYQDHYNEYDFDTISRHRTARFHPIIGEQNANFSYATLLKMVLINIEYKNKGIKYKLNLLRTFMSDEIRAIPSFELILATEYFAGLRAKFLPFQVGSRFGKQMQRLQAAAWDLRLLRTSDFFLAGGDHSETTLVTFCTADRELHDFGSKFSLEMITCGDGESFRSAHAYDWSALEKRVGKKQLDDLHEDNRQFQLSRQDRQFVAPPISDDELNTLIQYLEEQLKSYCSDIQ